MYKKELIRKLINFDDDDDVNTSTGHVSVSSDMTPQQRVLNDYLEELNNGRKDYFGDIAKKYFEKIKPLTLGLLGVCLNGRWNIVDVDNGVGYLSNIWFDEIENCGYERSWMAGGLEKWDNVFRVKKDGKYNFFLTDKETLLNRDWFDYASPHFVDGFSPVKKNNKWNYLGLETGKLLSPEWFDRADVFRWGAGVVEKSGKYNVIGTDGKLWSDEWYDKVVPHNEDGVEVPDMIVVVKDGKYNVLSKNERKVIGIEWYDYVNTPSGMFDDAIAEVSRDKGDEEYEYNFIDRWGDLISDEWFDEVVSGFDNEYNNDAYYSYDPEEDEEQDDIPIRTALVKKDGKEYILDAYGDMYET